MADLIIKHISNLIYTKPRTDYFHNLSNEYKTKEVCKRAFRMGVPFSEFPEQFHTEEYVLDFLNDFPKTDAPFMKQIPKELRTVKVLLKAIEVQPENIRIVPYEKQNQEMVDIALNIKSRYTSPFAIQYCNPIYISSEHISSSWEDSNADCYLNEYSSKYDELKNLYLKK